MVKYRMEPTTARAEPMIKVVEMTLLILMPMRRLVSKSLETARIAIPKGADLRIVAPGLPVNIDYIDLYDTDEKPSVPGLRPSAPSVAELREKLFAGEYGKFDEVVFATRTHRREHWPMPLDAAMRDSPKGRAIPNRDAPAITAAARNTAMRRRIRA